MPATGEARRKIANNYYHRNSKKIMDKVRQRRLNVIAKLGGECKKCHFSDWRALQVDHVYGGGNKERREMSVYKVHTMALKDTEGKYQLLCANCNWIKRYENNELNHL